MGMPPPDDSAPIWVQRSSGLFVLGDVPDLRRRRVRLGEAMARGFVLPFGVRPTSLDDFRISPGAADLGIPAMDLDMVSELLSDVPFEPAVLAISRIASAHWHIWDDGTAQVELARTFLGGGPGLDRIRKFIDQAPTHLVFSEQHFFVLHRLLFEYARDGDIEGSMTPTEAEALWYCLFGMTSVIEDADRELTQAAATSSDAWLAYTIKNGAYFQRPAPRNAMARAFAISTKYARESTHHDRCDLDDWMREDYAGLSIEEQLAAGFALYQTSRVLDSDAPISERNICNFESFSSTALAARTGPIADVLSADRAWYCSEFAGSTGSTLVWDRRPFLQRPFLQLANGNVVLISPRAITEWLGDGTYYRGLDSARARRAQNRYSPWVGDLVERYAVDLVRAAYPEPRHPGTGHVHGEIPYDGRKTPDVIVDFGTDIVAIEVCSCRLTRDTLLGDLDALSADLDRKVFAKVQQLGNRISDILSGAVEIPGGSLEQLARIWPIVVTASLMHTELLAEAIERELPDVLRHDARVQPVTILDIEDLELLVGLVEAGASLIGVLTSKTSGQYQHLEFRRWVAEDSELPTEAAPSVIGHWLDTEQSALTAALWASDDGC